MNLNSSPHMYSPNYTHSNHRDNFIHGIDDHDTSSNHILTQNPNQTNVTSSHGNNCDHKKLKFLVSTVVVLEAKLKETILQCSLANMILILSWDANLI